MIQTATTPAANWFRPTWWSTSRTLRSSLPITTPSSPARGWTSPKGGAPCCRAAGKNWIGETGLRKTEGLLLKWHFVNLDGGILTVEASKNRKVRHIPLSDFAIELFETLPRIAGVPYCFARRSTMDRWKDPDGALQDTIDALGWPDWIRGWHDFRHYRATQWIIDGMDVVTVKNLMGHRDLSTTQRYVHYVSEHAKDAVKEAEQRELARLKAAQEKQATNRQRPKVTGGAMRRQI